MKPNRLSKIVLSAAFLATSGLTAGRAEAQHISVGVGISLPPLVFPAPPTLVALPGTYVYAVPDYYDAEIFFVDGYWWRPWNGHWYRSAYYDHGWGAYSGVPYFYSNVPRDWRVRYRNREWGGHPWNYERVGYTDVQRNWSSWKRDRHWERNWDRTRTVSSDRRGDRGRDNNYRGDARAGTRSDQRYRGGPNTSERRGDVKSATPARERKAAPGNRSERMTSPQHSEKRSTTVRGSGGTHRNSGNANRSSGAMHSGGGRSSGSAHSGGGSRGPSNVKSSGGGGRGGQQHGGGHGASQHGGGGGGKGGGHNK